MAPKVKKKLPQNNVQNSGKQSSPVKNSTEELSLKIFGEEWNNKHTSEKTNLVIEKVLSVNNVNFINYHHELRDLENIASSFIKDVSSSELETLIDAFKTKNHFVGSKFAKEICDNVISHLGDINLFSFLENCNRIGITPTEALYKSVELKFKEKKDISSNDLTNMILVNGRFGIIPTEEFFTFWKNELNGKILDDFEKTNIVWSLSKLKKKGFDDHNIINHIYDSINSNNLDSIYLHKLVTINAINGFNNIINSGKLKGNNEASEFEENILNTLFNKGYKYAKNIEKQHYIPELDLCVDAFIASPANKTEIKGVIIQIDGSTHFTNDNEGNIVQNFDTKLNTLLLEDLGYKVIRLNSKDYFEDALWVKKAQSKISKSFALNESEKATALATKVTEFERAKFEYILKEEGLELRQEEKRIEDYNADIKGSVEDNSLVYEIFTKEEIIRKMTELAGYNSANASIKKINHLLKSQCLEGNIGNYINEALLNACNKNNVKAQTFLIEKFGADIKYVYASNYPDVNALDEEGNSLLLNAIAENNFAKVKYFIENGADVNYLNNKDLTEKVYNTLIYKNPDLEMVYFLSANGLNLLEIKTKACQLLFKDLEYDPTIQLNMNRTLDRVIAGEEDYDISRSKQSNIYRILDSLIASKLCSEDDLKSYINSFSYGLPEAIEIFMAKFPQENIYKMFLIAKDLHSFVIRGEIKLQSNDKTFKSHMNAYPDDITFEEYVMQYPTLLNLYLTRPEDVRVLFLDFKDVSNLQWDGYSIFMHASTVICDNKNKFEVLKLLLDLGCDINELMNDRYNNPLSNAICNKDYDLEEFLINKGADKELGKMLFNINKCLEKYSDNEIQSYCEKYVKEVLDIMNNNNDYFEKYFLNHFPTKDIICANGFQNNRLNDKNTKLFLNKYLNEEYEINLKKEDIWSIIKNHFDKLELGNLKFILNQYDEKLAPTHHLEILSKISESESDSDFVMNHLHEKNCFRNGLDLMIFKEKECGRVLKKYETYKSDLDQKIAAENIDFTIVAEIIEEMIKTVECSGDIAPEILEGL